MMCMPQSYLEGMCFMECNNKIQGMGIPVDGLDCDRVLLRMLCLHLPEP